MNDATLISLVTIIIGFMSSCILYLLKICFKSKCETVQCLCFKIKRNTKDEITAEEMELKHQPRLTSRDSLNNVV